MGCPNSAATLPQLTRRELDLRQPLEDNEVLYVGSLNSPKITRDQRRNISGSKKPLWNPRSGPKILRSARTKVVQIGIDHAPLGPDTSFHHPTPRTAHPTHLLTHHTPRQSVCPPVKPPTIETLGLFASRPVHPTISRPPEHPGTPSSALSAHHRHHTSHIPPSPHHRRRTESSITTPLIKDGGTTLRPGTTALGPGHTHTPFVHIRRTPLTTPWTTHPPSPHRKTLTLWCHSRTGVDWSKRRCDWVGCCDATAPLGHREHRCLDRLVRFSRT